MCDKKDQVCWRLSGDEREHTARGKEHMNRNLPERPLEAMRSKRINCSSTYFDCLVAVNVGDAIKN